MAEQTDDAGGAGAATMMLIDPPAKPPSPAASGPRTLLSPQQAARRAHRLARLPERLVLVVDLAAEMGRGWNFPGDETTRLEVVKLLVERILTQKARLDRRHQFALVVLHDEGAALLQGFTSDTRAVLATAAHLEPVAPWRDDEAPEQEDVDEEAEKEDGAEQGPEDQKGWDLPGLFTTLQQLFLDASASSSSGEEEAGEGTYIHRALLLLGRSYALPRPLDAGARAALAPLWDSERFFLDVLYVHGVEGAPGVVRRRPQRVVGAGKKNEKPPAEEKEGVDVEVVDVEDSAMDEGEEGAAGAAQAAAAAAAVAPAAEPVLPPLPPVRAQAIWHILLEFAERHPWRPQGDFLFEVMHGLPGVQALLVRAQMLLAHPVQRDSQDRMLQKADPFYRQQPPKEPQPPVPKQEEEQQQPEEKDGKEGGGVVESGVGEETQTQEEEEGQGQGQEEGWVVAEEGEEEIVYGGDAAVGVGGWEAASSSPPDSPKLPTVRAVALPVAAAIGGVGGKEEEVQGLLEEDN